MHPQTDLGDETKGSSAAKRAQTELGDEGECHRARLTRVMVALALALPGLTFLFARWWSVPLYVSNDDVAVEFLLRGVCTTSRATAFVLFMHVGLGQILVWLYAHLHGVPWYWVVMNCA